MSSLSGQAISHRLIRLGEILVEFQPLWQLRAFHHLSLPWEAGFSGLANFLREMPYEKAVALQTDDNALLEAVSEYLPVAKDILQLIDIPYLADTEKFHYPSRLVQEIPGRKLEQINRFLNCVPAGEKPVIDWCCGKGHLGRLAAFRCCSVNGSNVENSVAGLEWNADLVAAGNHYADKYDLPITLHQVNVLSDDVKNYLNHNSKILALHACGDLHLQLLKQFIQGECSEMYLSPCCYHLITDDNYQPLSQLAKIQLEKNRSPLLSRDMLRTAVQQTVTAPHYSRIQREKMQAWRLGFDLLQRDIFQSKKYFPVPTLSNDWLKESFENFCRYLAQSGNLVLPENIDWAFWENAGRCRFEKVTALDLARLAFRRAMEIWLVMDRAQYLLEHDYHVDVLQFCQQALTPRNLLLAAASR